MVPGLFTLCFRYSCGFASHTAVIVHNIWIMELHCSQSVVCNLAGLFDFIFSALKP